MTPSQLSWMYAQQKKKPAHQAKQEPLSPAKQKQQTLMERLLLRAAKLKESGDK